MPKRSAPPASTSAFPSGTAFRKSASKKRKGDSEPVKVDVSSTKTDSQKVNGAANKGKGKAKQTTPAANLPKTATKNANSIPQYDGKDVQAALHRTAAINAATNGKKKETARFKEPSLKEASTSKPKSKASEEDKAMFQPSKKDLGPPSSFRIVVGSYERLLYGFHVTFQNDGAQRSASFETMFSFAAHTSCISAIAAAGADSKWLATGAGDETVRVWDLKKKKEVGGLVGHNGTIHSLSFPARTYLLSADSSGLINLYRTRDWSLLKTLRGHTGQVNACVAHPSGRLALSVGKDGMLRMWDLMRGKGAGAVRLNLGQEEGGKVLFKEEPLDVKWNSSGTRFAVMGRTEVVVYKTDMSRIAGLLVRRDDPKRRFGCVEWQGDDVLLTGNEMGVVEVYKVNDQSLEGPVGKLLGHTNRVRDVRTIQLQLEEKTDLIVATTASSDGKIRLYDISSLVNDHVDEEQVAVELQPLATHNTGGARLTCLDVVGGSAGSKASSVVGLQVDENDDDEEDEQEQGAELNQKEMEELYDLLDLVEEAKRQGVEVEGLSEFESGESGSNEDDDDGDEDDVYGDSDSDGLEGESAEDELEDEEEDEDEIEQESD